MSQLIILFYSQHLVYIASTEASDKEKLTYARSAMDSDLITAFPSGSSRQE